MIKKRAYDLWFFILLVFDLFVSFNAVCVRVHPRLGRVFGFVSELRDNFLDNDSISWFNNIFFWIGFSLSGSKKKL